MTQWFHSRFFKWVLALAAIALVWIIPFKSFLNLIVKTDTSIAWGLSDETLVFFRLLVSLLVLMIATGTWRSLVAEIERREDPRFLAAFRIGIGLSVVAAVGSVVFCGAVEAVWIDRAYGGSANLGDGTLWIALFGGPNPKVVWTFVWVSLLSGISLLFGFLGKISAFVALQSTMSLFYLNPYAGGGGSTSLLLNALWLLVLGRSSKTWSIDCLLKNRAFCSHELVPAWPRHLAVLQILLCYWTTGLQKVSIHWVPGGDLSALYYIMQQPSWQRFDNTWAAWVYPLTQLGTATVWFWEWGVPVWGLSLWLAAVSQRPKVRKVANVIRWIFFGAGIFLHVMIYVVMDIGPFSLVSLAFYPCLLIASDLQMFKSLKASQVPGSTNTRQAIDG